jgi:hypothetical protein
MLESDLSSCPTKHEECSPVHGAMMRGAQREEVSNVVPASVGLRIQVMDVDEHGVPTAGHGAAPRITTKNPPSD